MGRKEFNQHFLLWYLLVIYYSSNIIGDKLTYLHDLSPTKVNILFIIILYCRTIQSLLCSQNNVTDDKWDPAFSRSYQSGSHQSYSLFLPILLLYLPTFRLWIVWSCWTWASWTFFMDCLQSVHPDSFIEPLIHLASIIWLFNTNFGLTNLKVRVRVNYLHKQS